MVKQLVAKKKRLVNGYELVPDLVKRLVIQVEGEVFSNNEIWKHFPYYVKWIRKSGIRTAEIRVDSIEWSNKRWEIFYDNVDVPSDFRASLIEVWDSVKEALDLLVGLVMDGNVKGRLEPINGNVRALKGKTNGHWFRGQKYGALCTSYLDLSASDDERSFALLSFKTRDVLATVAKAADRRIANGTSRGLSQKDAKELGQLFSQIVEEACQKSAGLLRLTKGDVVEIVDRATAIPLKKAKTDTKRVAISTVHKEIKKCADLREFMAKRGDSKPDLRETAKRFVNEFSERYLSDNTR